MANKLLLFDGNALVHRAYHALPLLTSREGQLVNAVYGFFSSLLAAVNLFEPTHLMVAFDVAGPTFRNKLYEQYKATRVAADQALYDQIPLIQHILTAMNVPTFGVQGFEADDVIATIVAKIQNAEVIIVTGDNDALQLVSKTVRVYSLARGIKQAVVYDERAVKEKYGIAPSKLRDFKALAGDASDNVKGIIGIGPKGALVLIGQYGTLENIIKKSPRVKQYAAEARLAKQIVTMSDNVPLTFDLHDARLANVSWQAAAREFGGLGFQSLVKRLPGSQGQLFQ